MGAALRSGPLHGLLDVTGRQGLGGRQLWVDLTLGVAPAASDCTADLRLSAASIADGRNPMLTGIFYGAQVWGSYRLTRTTRVSVMVEENINPLTHLDTRVFLLFDLRAVL